MKDLDLEVLNTERDESPSVWCYMISILIVVGIICAMKGLQ